MKETPAKMTRGPLSGNEDGRGQGAQGAGRTSGERRPPAAVEGLLYHRLWQRSGGRG